MMTSVDAWKGCTAWECCAFTLVWFGPSRLAIVARLWALLGDTAPPVGAGLPANTGKAGARHRLGLFTG
ncbi:hypothetical protein CXB65_08495 [Pseudomonas monteilii]|uniref:Uncharacterized protein n=1 Tax=Pseudomonas monteilii TaxID=76759 RepID=A0A2N1IU50_9PSED|nr:hypothetical protein CXB65_08495 [Pseudomonas monteilii]